MEPIQACILGMIQGLTEFLPISSSGHLVLFQHLFGLEGSQLFFDVSVHVGTLVAVILFYREDIGLILSALMRFIVKKPFFRESENAASPDPHLRLVLLIIVGSIPTAIIGLLFREMADAIFSSVLIVGFMLIITGIVLWGSRRLEFRQESPKNFSIKNALTIGVVQGAAILPGISRSGSTIVTGLFLGLNRETAARYSFLLSIPAILGAEILSFKDLSAQEISINIPVLVGSVTACITGYLSLKFLLYVIRRGNLHTFAPYCWAVGILTLILGI